MKKRTSEKKLIKWSDLAYIKRILRKNKLHTVCEESKCPNITECFSRKTATFMILGNICTRKCLYCSVRRGKPLPVNPEEPINVARAVKILGLKYVVITSVTRDDLEDKGASQFAQCIREIKKISKDIKVEVLTPDFQGDEKLASIVLKEKPFVFNCNIETVKRLYPLVRPQGKYEWVLKLLKFSKENFPEIYTKSGLIVGLGETFEDIKSTLEDLRESGCDILTVGQYLQPTKRNMKVQKEYSTEEFEKIREYAEELGFKGVFVGRWIRSSYMAEELISKLA
jgi:lipoic acid synthetase